MCVSAGLCVHVCSCIMRVHAYLVGRIKTAPFYILDLGLQSSLFPARKNGLQASARRSGGGIAASMYHQLLNQRTSLSTSELEVTCQVCDSCARNIAHSLCTHLVTAYDERLLSLFCGGC